jgi:hypothetical protein
MKRLAFAFLLLGLMTAFLFSPRLAPELEKQFCVKIHDVWERRIHWIVNCDSGEFLYLARHPLAVLTLDHRLWQSRPIYPLIGFVLALPIRVLLGPFGGESTVVPEYAAFVLLNAMLLMASVALVRRLLRADSPLDAWMIFPVTMLLVNELTKPFFWTPHLQIFNIAVPIGSIALYAWLRPRRARLSGRQFAGLGLLLGIASLAYGAVIVTAIGAFFCALLGDASARTPIAMGTRLRDAGVLLVSFVAPIVAWFLVVVARVGSFFSRETADYRQFVWMLDAAREGVFVPRLLQHLETFLDRSLSVTLFPGIALVIAMLIRGGSGATHPQDGAERDLRCGVLLYLTAAVLFFAPMGYYASRNLWSLVPPLVLLLGLELRALVSATSGRRRTLLSAALVTISGVYVVYWVVRRGPWA